MPSHALHIEYCKLAGIKSLAIIKDVNDMIDFPRSCRKYKEFREKKGQLLYSSNDVRCVNQKAKFNNDLARRYFEDAELDLKFLCQQSEDYCVAYFLHHLFDLYEELFPRHATISDRRHAARKKMEACFGHKCLGGNLLSRYGMRSYYKKAEDFFKGPKSQYWLDNRFAKYYKQKKDKDL